MEKPAKTVNKAANKADSTKVRAEKKALGQERKYDDDDDYLENDVEIGEKIANNYNRHQPDTTSKQYTSEERIQAGDAYDDSPDPDVEVLPNAYSEKTAQRISRSH